MAFIPTPNTVKVDLLFYMSSQQIHNIFHVEGASTWTQEEREDLIDAVAGWWAVTGNQGLSDEISLIQITATNQESAEAPSSTLVIVSPVSGTSSSAPLATGTAICATLRTDLRGRCYRGRQYIAGCTTTWSTDGLTLIPAAIAQVLISMLALFDAIEALSKVWVIVSKQFNNNPRSYGVTTPVTAFSCDGYLDSQRRRLGGRGV